MSGPDQLFVPKVWQQQSRCVGRALQLVKSINAYFGHFEGSVEDVSRSKGEDPLRGGFRSSVIR